MEDQEYNRKYSHFHCWNQGKSPACGQPLEKHTQCCLCDTPYKKRTMSNKPKKEGWEEEFDEWYDLYWHKSPSEDKARKIKLKQLVSSFVVNAEKSGYKRGITDKNVWNAVYEIGKEETREQIKREVEKLDTFWRHPMALYVKDHVRQDELNPMVSKDSVLQILTTHNL